MFQKIKDFVESTEHHHEVPVIHVQKRHLGIILTLVGFLLYAFYTMLFQIEATRDHTSNSLSATFTEFTILYFFMAVVYLPLCMIHGKSFFHCQKPKLIFWRAIFSNLCLWLYSIARVWTETIDNSMLYSTDAFWVIAIMAILGIRVNYLTTLGVTIGLLGIGFIYYYDLKSAHDLIGGIFGVFSGLFLGIVIILTKYMVLKDPPLRIAFYSSIFGFFISLGITIILGFTFGWHVPSGAGIVVMMFAGLIFALTLFCFLEAFYYTESYVIGAVSYFFPVFLEMINWIITQESVSLKTIVGSIVLTLGGLIVLSSTHFKKNKNQEVFKHSL